MMSANGTAGNSSGEKTIINPAIMDQPSGLHVQFVLCRWYSHFKSEKIQENQSELFPERKDENLIANFKNDLDLLPVRLMNELVNGPSISDKGQYIRLVQALLINISDILHFKQKEFHSQCQEIENILEFMQDFFYQYFDFDFRTSNYYYKSFTASFGLKLNYWKIKLKQSKIIDVLIECMNAKLTLPDHYLTFRKASYLKYLFQQIESATTIINEIYLRELLLYYNFNDSCFVDYEIKLIKEKITGCTTTEEIISLLRDEKLRINELITKQDFCFDNTLPCLKKQLNDWISNEIIQLELSNQRKTDKDLQLGPESKIQTSLSVAKLAVIIRLLVADKIIINKSVAPMLRTVAKLFTTLQKDEISFGSLETKYHAPDNATLTIMKEMLQKWVRLIGKL